MSARTDEDQGSALVFALGVMLLVSVLSAGLLGFVRTNLAGQRSLKPLRDREYAADAALEGAVVALRSNASLMTQPCTAIVTGAVADPAVRNGQNIHVDCRDNDQVVALPGRLVVQRNVVLSACAGSSCTGPAVITAQVNFAVLPGTNGPAAAVFVQSWSVNR